MGTCAMAAGAANLRGSTISTLSVLIFSSLLKIALKKRLEVAEGMPHSSKLKFEAWDNLKRIGEPSSRENVADDGSYEDRHDRLS